MATRRGKKGEERNVENPTIPVSSPDFLAFFGLNQANLPHVTVDSALCVPAVAAAVAFLSRTMASLPLHAYRDTKDGPKKISGKLESVIHDAPNDEMDSFKFRQYFWQQVFTGGRGLAWIERTPQGVDAIWPMNPYRTTVRRVDMKLVYSFDGKDYPSADIIDLPFMLRPCGIRHYGPVVLASKAIQLALAMNDYASNFFAGGGVPPLALVGPLPAGAEAIKRAQGDIKRAIDSAKSSNQAVFPVPSGYELKPVGFDPAKGQMIDARRFQVEEIARAWQIPPVFLQDLTQGTFSNTEQQDLFFVKHLVGQWSEAFEGELNLKLFGRGNNGRYVEHNLDGLLRGDFASRMTGYATAIQNAIRTPDEVRQIENLPAKGGAADKLLVQGATVPLGTQPAVAGEPTNDNSPKPAAGDNPPKEPKAA